MSNLMFSLNATMPVFLLMVLGYIFNRIGWLDDVLAEKLNKFVFAVPLPVLLFGDLATVDFDEAWDTRFVIFCFAVTFACIMLAVLMSFVIRDRSIRGEFVQAAYRSSAALLGISFITNIYGDSGMGPLMIIGSVPLYNIMAVIVLSFSSPSKKNRGFRRLFGTVKNIVTNPILIGIAAGLLWSLFKLPMPYILEKTVSYIGDTASPLGLMAMGATFRFGKAAGKMKSAIAASFMKLVGFECIFLPLAVLLGFREQELVAIMIMLGSATTVSCYVMARNMGHEGTLTSNAVMLTTFFSAFTVTLWLYILRSMGLI